MATAILSAVRNQPVRQDVAMTGEITLSGLVLPIGGVREKALAARRAGIRTVILPALNEPDLAELPEEIRKDMTFVPVETLEQVVNVALAPAPEGSRESFSEGTQKRIASPTPDTDSRPL
jgi:ATP-dependent Lon protease